MGKYRVSEPITFMDGKKVVQYYRPAEWVDIDDATAKKLGDAVERMDKPEPKPADSKAADK